MTSELLYGEYFSVFEIDGEWMPALVSGAPAISGDRIFWGTGHHGLFYIPTTPEAGPGATLVGEGGVFLAFELCPRGTRASEDFSSCEKN